MNDRVLGRNPSFYNPEYEGNYGYQDYEMCRGNQTEKKKNKVEHYTYEDYDDEDDYWKVTGDNQEQQDSQQYPNNQQHNDDQIAHQNHGTDDLRSEENNNDIDRRHANSCGTWTRCAQ